MATLAQPFGKTSRTYRPTFQSKMPQRPSLVNPDPMSARFQRSGADVLGPGSYDAMALSWVKDELRQFSSFSSKSVQRKELKGLLSADIDFADSDSRELMNSVYGTAPGAGGQRWSPTPRGPPFFHTKSRPYPGLAGEAIGRDDGLDMYYDSAATTLAARADTTPRRYASAFPPKEARTGQLGRVIPKKDLASNLGPGTYHSPSRTFGKGVACGGLKTLDEWDRPSSTFAPRVGGKFAHVGGGGYW